MICTKCKNRWSVSEEVALGNCPVCGADSLMMLNSQLSNPSVDAILKNIIVVFGRELLSDQEQLSLIIGDVFSKDQRLVKLLRLSVQFEIPKRLSMIYSLGSLDSAKRLSDLSTQIQETEFLKEEVIHEMFRYWELTIKALYTVSTKNEHDDGEWLDEFGVTYSANKKKLKKCTSIKYSYNIIPGTKVICDFAFDGCYDLEHLNIPSSVAAIGEFAFQKCSRLVGIFVHESNRNFRIIDGVLYDASLKTIICHPRIKFGLKKTYAILETTTIIRELAFDWCQGLENIIIPDSVTSIGEFAFNFCYGLKSLIIPESVTKIGVGAFQSCTKLKSITIPNLITSIEDFVFNCCSGLESIVLPDSVKSIGNIAPFPCDNDFFQIVIGKDNEVLKIRLFELGFRLAKSEADIEYWLHAKPIYQQPKSNKSYNLEMFYEPQEDEEETWWDEEIRREWENDPENPKTWGDE